MTCGGCGTGEAVEVRARMPAMPEARLPIVARLGACHCCPKGRRGRKHPENGVILCTVDRRRIATKVRRGECRHWPDANGTVHGRFFDWWGVPEPRRWLGHWRSGRAPRLSGCGCIVPLKANRDRWPWRALAWILETIPSVRAWIMPRMIKCRTAFARP